MTHGLRKIRMMNYKFVAADLKFTGVCDEDEVSQSSRSGREDSI